MHWLIPVVAVLALVEAGWFTFDGTRALATGDYVTPKTGPYAGQLGPWAKVVSAVGIAPRSTGMKVIFVVYGGTWIVFIAAVLWGAKWAWWAMLMAALAAVWYLPFGTLLSTVQAVLLLLPPARATFQG